MDTSYEFHVLSTKKCNIHQTEQNFKYIKDSLQRLRQDLHEAEIDFHRQPLDMTPDDDAKTAHWFQSSVGLLHRCRHPWTETGEKDEVNSTAAKYYNNKKKYAAKPVEEPGVRTAHWAGAALPAARLLSTARGCDRANAAPHSLTLVPSRPPVRSPRSPAPGSPPPPFALQT
jgi:hypothetical protein